MSQGLGGPADFGVVWLGHDVGMPLLRKIILVVGLLVSGAGVALFTRFLVGQGVATASSWATLVGLGVSVLGVVVAVLKWLRPGSPPPTRGEKPSGGSEGRPVSATGGSMGDVQIEAHDHGVAAGVVQGPVLTGNPRRPDPA